MSIALFQALAVASGGLASLGMVLVILLLLHGKGGPYRAFAFALGYWGAYALIGLAFTQIEFGPTSVDGSAPSPIRAVIFTFVGLLMTVFTILTWRKPLAEEPEQPKFLTKLDGVSGIQALGLGALVPVINFKNLAIYLSAISILSDASLESPMLILGILLTDLVFCGALLAPLLIYLLLPRRAELWLTRMRRWIEANSQKVPRYVLPVFACLFLARGLPPLWVWLGA